MVVTCVSWWDVVTSCGRRVWQVSHMWKPLMYEMQHHHPLSWRKTKTSDWIFVNMSRFFCLHGCFCGNAVNVHYTVTLTCTDINLELTYGFYGLMPIPMYDWLILRMPSSNSYVKEMYLRLDILQSNHKCSMNNYKWISLALYCIFEALYLVIFPCNLLLCGLENVKL